MKLKFLFILANFVISWQAFADETILAKINETAMQEKSIGNHYAVIKASPLFLDEANLKGKDQGRIVAFSDVTLLRLSGDYAQVEIEGWQPENVAHVIYAEKGKRIMKVALRKDQAENIQILDSKVDQDTDQIWNRVKLMAWMDTNKLMGDPSLLHEYGSLLNVKNCSACHAIEVDHFLANQWPSILKSMKRFVSMEKEEYDFLQMYLQYNAKDMQKEKKQ